VYEDLYDERAEEGVWHTVAYIEGYMNGLCFLLASDEDRKKMPLYYVAGYEGDLRKPEEYKEAAPKFEELNSKTYEYARGEAAKLAPGVVFQHMPSI
jgi:hypothetical protein